MDIEEYLTNERNRIENFYRLKLQHLEKKISLMIEIINKLVVSYNENSHIQENHHQSSVDPKNLKKRKLDTNDTSFGDITGHLKESVIDMDDYLYYDSFAPNDIKSDDKTPRGQISTFNSVSYHETNRTQQLDDTL